MKFFKFECYIEDFYVFDCFLKLHKCKLYFNHIRGISKFHRFCILYSFPLIIEEK